jgi:hypothetical protein
VPTVIETRTQTLSLSEEGIVYAKVKPNVEVGRGDAEEVVRAIRVLVAGKARPTLIDMGELKFIDREARTYFAGPETATVEAAAALIVRSPIAKAVGNFFLGLNKPLTPTRLFSSEAEALDWLRCFLT